MTENSRNRKIKSVLKSIRFKYLYNVSKQHLEKPPINSEKITFSKSKKYKKKMEERRMSKTEIKKELIASFSSDIIAENDLKVAVDLVDSVLFDKYDEKAHCQILTGINITDFKALVSRLSARFKLSKEVEESILDSEYALQNDKVIREFTFKLGEAGEVKYGRVATIRRGATIDLAYSLYFVDFKFTAKKMDDRFSDKIRLFKDSAMSIMRPDPTELNLIRKERNVTTIEKEHFLTYFRYKALMLFKEEYPLVDLMMKEHNDFYEDNGHRNCTIL